MSFGGERHLLRATGLVRTVVVAAATLAILVVCFTIYQQAQVAPGATPTVRLPPVPSQPGGDAIPAAPRGPSTTAGVEIGAGRVGPGEKVHLTIYEPEGNRARLEIAVDDWTPLEGSTNEFVLSQPEFRLRTKDGHAVRATARRGVLEAQRRVGGGLDAKRGRLSGDVVIQYDRLTEAQRAALPEGERKVAPRDLIEARVDLIEFDLEYLKLLVPGAVHVVARDVRLDAADLEIRFSDAEDRVEYLRISKGGSLELPDEGQGAGLSIPATDSVGDSELSLAQWLRAALEARLAAREHVQEAKEPRGQASTPTITYTAEGTPIFHLDQEDRDVPEPPLRYRARFEGEVEARELLGEQTRAHLSADNLEIVRVLSEEDPRRIQGTGAAGMAAPGAGETSAESRHVLTWSDRLVVEVCGPQDAACSEAAPSTVVAVGDPVRITRPDGSATCRRFTYQPDGSSVTLVGTVAEPVVVRYAEQGTVIGTAVHSERHGDDTTLDVTGPGTLIHETGRGGGAADVASASEAGAWVVEFAERLAAHGRFMTRPRLGLASGIALVKRRILDRAEFRGSVRMRRGDTSVSADLLSLSFMLPSAFTDDEPIVERVVARGHVNVTRGPDRLRSRDIEVAFAPGPDGRAVPTEAIAVREVVVEQADGATIEARDKLIVTFAPSPKAAAKPQDDERSQSIARTALSAEAPARKPIAESAGGESAMVKRVQAFGKVRVLDPRQDLEVRSEGLDCTVLNGREIDRAILEGADDEPAWVRLATFSVSGKRVSLHVPEERASVPGAGRLTFRSEKDLDGRRTAKPIPVAVTWTRRMEFDGRANRSVFEGDVHAASQKDTTFDCQRLLVEFVDAPASKPAGELQSSGDWWIVGELTNRLWPSARAKRSPWQGRQAKEPVYILATGDAVALTSETDPATGRLKSRARIAGPQLSVDLRSEASKMVIEGAGNLLLEDYAPPDATPSSPTRTGLFGASVGSGPSNTLIEWMDLMWYDFSIDQTRFEGNVTLKHLSGARLAGIRGPLLGSGAAMPPGRATYLRCDVLTVDFSSPDERRQRPADRRVGRISAERLKQLQAAGSVVLQDESEGLSLTAQRVVFWKDRDMLGVFGAPGRKAHIVTQRPGGLPNQLSVERLFYNLATKQWELSKPFLKTR